MDQLQTCIGKWGRYQTFIFILTFISSFMDGCQTLIAVFIYSIPNTRCFVPGYDGGENRTYDSPFKENISRVLFTDPKSEEGKYVYCSYCPYVANSTSGCEPARARACDHGYVYDHSQFQSTLGMELDMVCDETWRREVLLSMYMIGVLIGGFSGTLSDRVGRKKIYVTCGAAQVVIANVLPFAVNFYAFGVLQLLMGMFEVGTFLTGFIIVTEMVEGAVRTLSGIAYQLCFSVGYMYLAMVAYLIRDWRWIQWACSIPLVFYFVDIWFLPESLRWLIMKGRQDEARAQIATISKWNNVRIPQDVIERALAGKKEEERSLPILVLFKYKRLALITIAMGITWIVSAMAYYGLSLNTNDWPGNNYQNFVYAGLADIPGFILVIPMFHYLGRKPSLVGSLVMGGVFCIASGLIPTEQATALLVCAVIGKMWVSSAFAMAYNYSAEVFPTSARNAALGFCSTCARIGSISAPQIHLLAYYVALWLPVIIFGAVEIVAAVLDFSLPETHNRMLPETIDDALAMT